MKTFKCVFTVMALFISGVALAQKSSQGAASAPRKLSEGWNMVYVQFAPTREQSTYYLSGQDLKGNLNLTGLVFGYAHVSNVTSSLPLYVQVGGELKYSFNKKKNHDDAFLSLKVPVSLTYNVPLTDRFNLLPFAGIYGRYNVSGTSKDANGRDVNLFEKPTETSAQVAYERFQLGWQAGCNLLYRQRYLIGASYSRDISKLVLTADTKYTTFAFNFSVGLIF